MLATTLGVLTTLWVRPSYMYTSSLVSAKPRSLLKLDQAYIAVGGREHFKCHLAVSSERPTLCAPLRFEISPRAAEAW